MTLSSSSTQFLSNTSTNLKSNMKSSCKFKTIHPYTVLPIETTNHYNKVYQLRRRANKIKSQDRILKMLD